MGSPVCVVMATGLAELIAERSPAGRVNVKQAPTTGGHIREAPRAHDSAGSTETPRQTQEQQTVVVHGRRNAGSLGGRGAQMAPSTSLTIRLDSGGMLAGAQEELECTRELRDFVASFRDGKITVDELTRGPPSMRQAQSADEYSDFDEAGFTWRACWVNRSDHSLRSGAGGASRRNEGFVRWTSHSDLALRRRSWINAGNPFWAARRRAWVTTFGSDIPWP
jgi:hypothetical protein